VALTPREAEILDRLGRAMSNQEIGDDLFLSVNSVKTHVRNLYRKLGVANRTEAVVWLHRHGRPGLGGPEPIPTDEVVAAAKGILMAEGEVSASGAAAVLAARATLAGTDLRRVAADLVAGYDTYARPVGPTATRVELLELCRRVRTAARETVEEHRT